MIFSLSHCFRLDCFRLHCFRLLTSLANRVQGNNTPLTHRHLRSYLWHSSSFVVSGGLTDSVTDSVNLSQVAHSLSRSTSIVSPVYLLVYMDVSLERSRQLCKSQLTRVVFPGTLSRANKNAAPLLRASTTHPLSAQCVVSMCCANVLCADEWQ